MTNAEQVRVAQAIQSLYDRAPVPAGWDLIDRTFVPEDPDPTSLILRDQASGKLARVFRGSVTGWDWREDFSFLMVDSPFGVGRTEQGFTAYYANARTESGRPVPPCDWFAGHSLGGPAATYASAVGGTNGGAEVLLIATPEPGDATFSLWASRWLTAIHRWENPHDVVPDAPGRFLGYRDLVGDPVVIDMTPLGILQMDFAGNHHLPNYVRAFQLQNP